MCSPLSKVYKFPASTIKWFPPSIQEKFSVDEGLLPATLEQYHEAASGRDLFYRPPDQYLQQPDRMPIVFIALYRCLVDYQHPGFQIWSYE